MYILNKHCQCSRWTIPIAKGDNLYDGMELVELQEDKRIPIQALFRKFEQFVPGGPVSSLAERDKVCHNDNQKQNVQISI